jgi:RimJ/RimL family protein N-acetyltransferase
MYPVRVTGERVVLREFTEDDIDAVLEVYGDPVVTEHLSFDPRDREQVAKTLRSVTRAAQADPRSEYSLAVELIETGTCIGFARLALDSQHPGQHSAQLGGATRADSWGRGLGVEVGELLLRLGFDELGLYRLWGARAPENEVSDRLMRKLGMTEEGRIRGHIKIGDTWRDSIVHSILEDEWHHPA